jgi:transcriptional regulator with XRE-family HTH domain
MALALSQEELAQTIGVLPGEIEAYETGQAAVPAQVLDRLADFFNVPLSYFFPSAPGPGG